MQSCVEDVNRRIMGHMDRPLPENIHVVLSLSSKDDHKCNYYMVHVHPDHQTIFWLDEYTFNAGDYIDRIDFDSLSHLGMSSPISHLWNEIIEPDVRKLYELAILGAHCTLPPCPYLPKWNIAGRN